MGTLDKGVRQRGQGQSPKFLILAARILYSMSEIRKNKETKIVLLGVVCHINEYAEVEAPSYSIKAFDDSPMQVCLDEIVIQNGLPLLVKHLAMAMCLEFGCWRPSCVAVRKIIEIIRKLEKYQPTKPMKAKKENVPRVDRLCDCKGDSWVYTADTWSHFRRTYKLAIALRHQIESGG
jgi:hypothetical protein